MTFKAATDDLRDSPALAVLRRVRARGAEVRAFDPTLPDPDDGRFRDLGLTLCDDPYSVCEGASVLVVLTEWPQFRDLDLGKVAAALARPAIVDTRNMLEPADARAAGCIYQGMGRSWREMRALVAGGAGFIGATFCARLLTAATRSSAPTTWSPDRRSNVKALDDRDGFAFLEADVASRRWTAPSTR